MPERPLSSQSGRRERDYIVEEKLVGVAIYRVSARNKREALAKVRASEAGGMLDSQVDHTGRGNVRRASDWESR